LKHLDSETYRPAIIFASIFIVCFTLSLGAQNPLSEDYFSLDPEPVTGDSFGPVTALAKGSADGSVWIGTEGEGILRIGRNGNRIHYSIESGHLFSDDIKEMCFVSDRRLFILYEDGGLTCYSSTEGFIHKDLHIGQISHILHGEEAGMLICSTDDGHIYKVDERYNSSLLYEMREAVAALSYDDAFNLYAAGESSMTVRRLDGSAAESITTALEDSPTCISVIKDGIILAGTAQGLYKWSDSSWTRYSTDDGLPSNRIYSIVSAGGGDVLIATGNGVVRLNVSNSNVSNSKIYFSGDSYQSVLASADSDSVFLFGGGRGIAVISSSSAGDVLPWSDEADDKSASGRVYLKFLWIIPFVLLIALFAFFIGRRKGRNVSEVVLVPPSPSVSTSSSVHESYPKPKPVVVTHNTVTPVPVNPSPAAPRSNDAVYDAIRKLKKKDAPDFSLKVWSMIQESYSDPKFTVEQIASRLMLSRVHVNRKLSQEIGVSPSAIIKAIRMTNARELIMKGDMTLPQVAAKCGFSSASYLSSSFKEYFGQSPSELLKR